MSDKDWKKEALALVVLLRAKCSDEEWANMESRFECTAPAPQPAEAATEWKVFSREAHAYLHGGVGALDYYPICAEVPKHECIALVFGKTDEEALRRAESILRQHFVRVAAATPQVTPTHESEARKWCDEHRKHPVIGKAIQGAQSWQPDGLATIVAYIFNQKVEGTSEQTSPAPGKCPKCNSADRSGHIVAWAGLEPVYCQDSWHGEVERG